MTSFPDHGLTAVAVTPLDESGDLDVDSVDTLMNWLIGCGVSGVALLGVMGEANRMTEAEARLVADRSLAALDGRVPAIVGISDPSLARMRALAHHAMQAGAAGVLLQPGPGLAGDAAVAGYFEQVCAALGPDVPVCVQDFPKASGVHLSLGAWARILETCPGVVGLKHEEEPGLTKLSALRAAEEAGRNRRVTVLTGNNGIHLVQELARGADGAMTGFAFPDVLAAVCDLAGPGLSGEAPDAAEDLFDTYLPLNRHELRLGIGVRKEILRRRGAIATAVCRFPVKPLSPIDLAELDRLMERLERRTGRSAEQIVTRADVLAGAAA